MLRIIYTIFSLVFTSFIINGMPSCPFPIKMDDGLIIHLKGDERCKWGTSEDGYTILPSERGWVYAQQSQNGFAEPSNYNVRKTRDLETKVFLETQPKGIPIKFYNYQSVPPKNQRNINFESKRIIGERKALVILMSFSDLDFRIEPNGFIKLFNEIGYSEDVAIGSVKDYFLWASYNQLEVTSDVIGPFKASHDMKYFGKNTGINGQDQNPFKLFEEALNYAKEMVELSDYDSDGDGFIDNIHIIFAGYGEEAGANPDAIWSHEMTFQPITVGNVKIDRYSCAPELRGNSGIGISRIGPHCHEMGHALGAMDYYDVDYSNNGQYQGTGDWDIMASGSWNNEGITPPDFNPYVKVFDFGWSNPENLLDGNNEIRPVYCANNQIFILPTPLNGDFFLIENRQKISFDSGIPGEGLLIFHIGSDIVSRSKNNMINAYFPQQCYVVCASSESKIPNSSPKSYGDINTSGCPFPGSTGNDEFTDTSIPAASCFNGTNSGILLSKINQIDDSKNICLFNGTIPPPNYVWTEDFETSFWKSSWYQEDTQWMIAYDESSEEDMMPIIHNSNYLYSRLPTSFNRKENIRKIKSQQVTLSDDNDYILKLDYFNSPNVISSSNYNNKLNIFLERPGKEPQLLSSFQQTNSDWKEGEIVIPKLESPTDVSFIFEARGPNFGYICIDNLRLQVNKNGEMNELDIKSIQGITIFIDKNSVTIDSPYDSNIRIYDSIGRLIIVDKIITGKSTFSLKGGVYFMYFSNTKLNNIKILVPS